MAERRREKDFLLRHDAKYVGEHAQTIANANAALDAISKALPEGDSRRDQVEAVRKGVTAYVRTFRTVADDEIRVGLSEKDGLMGSLRGSVHEVEAILNTYDDQRLAVLMLMMRRHEKDFLARKDAKYIDELAHRGTEFAKAIQSSAIPAQERPGVMQRMEAYQRDFNAAAEARSTGESADNVGHLSTEVAGGIDRLREVLVRTVRTATREVNRRGTPRYGFERQGTLSTGGRSVAVTIDNISEGGLMVSGLPAGIAGGTAVQIAIPGISHPLAAIVLANEHGRLHGRFELVPDAVEQWAEECRRLVVGLQPLAEVA